MSRFRGNEDWRDFKQKRDEDERERKRRQKEDEDWNHPYEDQEKKKLRKDEQRREDQRKKDAERRERDRDQAVESSRDYSQYQRWLSMLNTGDPINGGRKPGADYYGKGMTIRQMQGTPQKSRETWEGVFTHIISDIYPSEELRRDTFADYLQEMWISKGGQLTESQIDKMNFLSKYLFEMKIVELEACLNGKSVYSFFKNRESIPTWRRNLEVDSMRPGRNSQPENPVFFTQQQDKQKVQDWKNFKIPIISKGGDKFTGSVHSKIQPHAKDVDDRIDRYLENRRLMNQRVETEKELKAEKSASSSQSIRPVQPYYTYSSRQSSLPTTQSVHSNRPSYSHQNIKPKQQGNRFDRLRNREDSVKSSSNPLPINSAMSQSEIEQRCGMEARKVRLFRPWNYELNSQFSDFYKDERFRFHETDVNMSIISDDLKSDIVEEPRRVIPKIKDNEDPPLMISRSSQTTFVRETSTLPVFKREWRRMYPLAPSQLSQFPVFTISE